MLMAVLEGNAPPKADAVAKAWQITRTQGLAALGRRVAKHLVSPLLEAGGIELFVRDLREPLPSPKETKGIWLEIARPSMIPELLACRDTAQSRHELENRFARGDLCFIATDDAGKVAHFRWATKGRVYVAELCRDLVLPATAAYFYDGFTRADMRRRGIDGLVRCFIFATLEKEGYDHAYSHVHRDNAAGLRAAARWQRPCAKLRYLRPSGLAPLVFGGSSLPPQLTLCLPGSEPGADRAAAWRRWFEGWADQPLARRSTGYSELPEAYFVAMADFIASTLGLSPEAGRVLDVGCDSAMVTRHVAPRCDRLVGVDYVPDLLAARAEQNIATGSGDEASFAAADGCRLPFADGSFGCAYCAGVVHTLPSHEHGLGMIREMMRVCVPGGRVLVAGVPATGKRLQARREAWRRAGAAGRLQLIASLALPAGVKRFLRRRLDVADRYGLVALEYDLDDLAAELSENGSRCRVVDFPGDFWSRDFRSTSANLLIDVGAGAAASVDDDTSRRPPPWALRDADRTAHAPEGG